MIKVNYISRLPLKGGSPSILITENKENRYVAEFIDIDNDEIVNRKNFVSNEVVYGERQWYTNWLIKIYDEKLNLIHVDRLNLEHKTVFIKNDSKELDDTLSWIPYIDEFRKKHKCNIICSTFFNNVVKDRYTDIIFVSPNTYIENIYAQYYIGTSNEENEKYTPLRTGSDPLQKTACDILGLEYQEIRPDLENLVANTNRKIKEKYVCISEFGSDNKKMWKEGLDGWQKVVDFLNKHGYKVVVISKEKTQLKNIIDLTGNYSIYDRMIDLYHSEFFIGVSSGLSWLAWSVNKHVMLISDVTPINHEFLSNCTRISCNNLDKVDYSADKFTNVETVLSKIKKHLNIFDTSKIKIGITIGLKSINESIWTNGLKLNVLTLVNLLNRSSKNYEVFLLNTFDIDLTKKPIYIKDINVDFFDNRYTEMDLIIAMGVTITGKQIDIFKSIKPTNKLVNYKCGNNYVFTVEEMLFKESPDFHHIHVYDGVDEIWYVPQQHENNAGYYSTLYRKNAILVPFLWDKVFLDYSLNAVEQSYKNGKCKKDSKYDSTKDKKVIGIMEPNLNIIKTCIIPSLIVEESYRSDIGKKKIEKMMITNSKQIQKHNTFLSFIKTFDLYKDKKIRVEDRYQISYFLSQYADILVCHQLMNPLNYLYLDAAYMGYPVLHNAYLCKDLGYYYDGSSTKNASIILNKILENHDNNLEQYESQNKQVLDRYYVGNLKLIETYDILIENLFNGGNNKKELIYNALTNLYENI